MLTEDQSEVVALLASPSTHGGVPVERVETHASIVFLAGARAFKLKRAVRYDYLDFSTAARRKAMCDAELRVNRRTAPALYRTVVAITRESDGSLALGGAGQPVDWVVEMVRFDQDCLLDRLAARGALDLELMRPLASAIARFHRDAERRPDHGGLAGMSWVIEGNALGFREQGADIFDADACVRLTAQAREQARGHGALLERRREQGFVRQCHGDLHLRNIVLLDRVPTLFDGIEFNDEIACSDVLYDLAFLLMDLWRRDLPAHANAAWNGYLFESGDFTGIELLPFFLSCRAAVRAKTSATAARLQTGDGRSALEAAARSYLTLAQQLLVTPAPCIVAIGGVSGTGKSTVARAIAHRLGAAPGAVIVRSDEIRKQLCGVGPLDRLGPEAYTLPVGRQVYATLAAQAALVTHGRYIAIADAVFARPDNRAAIESAAASAGVPFVGVWLEAPESQLRSRIADRRDDASDADASVLRQQLLQDRGAVSWARIDASRPLAEVLLGVEQQVRDSLGGTLLSSPLHG
jgi:aminoglycoside phosphotransferase family enzyme/predicted kinase